MKRNPIIEIGIAGTGDLAVKYLRILNKLKRFHVRGFYTRDLAAGRVFEEEYKLVHYVDLEELLDKVDAIVFVSSEENTFELYSKIIRRAKHLFINRLETQDQEKVESLIELSEEAGIVSQIHLKKRFEEIVLSVLSLIHFPLYIDSQQVLPSKQALSSSTVFFNRIQLLLSIVNSSTKKIFGDGIVIPHSEKKVLNARVEFDNACVANITLDSIGKSHLDRIKFYHKDLTIIVDFVKHSIEIESFVDYRSLFPEDKPTLFHFTKDYNTNTWKSFVASIAEPEEDIFERELKRFYHSIVSQEKVEIDLSNLYESLLILNAMNVK